MTIFNIVTPELFWARRFRTSGTVLFLASLAILVGMWMERFVIIVTSLNRDFLTSSWHLYAPSWVDWGLLAGSVGLFGFLFLLFVRYIPAVALSEVKSLGNELSLSMAEQGGPDAVRHA
jgi:molybdopterin-containing oxidoreductase family membrane subunit